MLKSLKFTFLFLCLKSSLCVSSVAIDPDPKNNMELALFFNSLSIPDNEAYTNPDWKSLSKKLNSVSWLTEGIKESSELNQKINNFYFREGRAIFNNNGSSIYEVLGKTPQPGKWSVELLGSRSFVNEVSIKMLNNTQEYNFDIVGILKKKNYSLVPLKCNKTSEPASSGNVVYVIESNGFKSLWLKDEWSCGSAGCAAYVTLYYNKERAESTECYGS
ncbi:MAG: hypothetical protein V4660_17880 [Pseudomonadota bacterium]